MQSLLISCFGRCTGIKPGITPLELEKSILIAFSNNCGYSSLILHQNATSGNFLEISYSMKAETTAINPLYSCIKIDWSTLHFKCTFTHAWFYYIMIGGLEDVGSLKICLSSKCWHIIIQYQKKSSLISLSITSETFLIIGRLSSSQWQKQAF